LLAWVSLVPLIFALRGASPKQAALCGGIFGVALTLTLLYFIALFGYLPLILLALYQGAFFALLGLAWGLFLSRGGIVAFLGPAAIWAGLEWARSLGPVGHTFGALGYTQHNELMVAQVARIGGVYALSFLIVLVNLGIVEAIASQIPNSELGTRNWNLRLKQTLSSPRIIAGGLLLLSLFYGWMVLGSQEKDDAPVLRAAAIQPNPTFSFYAFSTADRWADLRRHVQMTIALRKWEPDLVVWPETSIQGSLFLGETFAEVVKAARQSGADLLVGSTEKEPPASPDQPVRTYNRAWLVSSEGKILGKYDKVKLVLFGEYVPFRHPLGFILNRYPIRSFDYVPGKEIVAFKRNGYSLGVGICFEELQPTLMRDACRKGADGLAIITNDGWFKRTAAAQHLAGICVFRAIENGAPVVRAAKTGISCLIDKYGRVLDKSDIFVEDSVKAEVKLRRGLTPYQKMGDLFAILCFVGAGAGLAYCFWNGCR
jgi:apolipoprotein N-acyltransferase